MRRLRRWLAGLVVATVLVAVALVAAGRSGALGGLERDVLVRLLERATGARVSLGAVGGTFGRSLVLEDLRVAAGGRTVAHVPRLEIVYAPRALLRGVLELRRVTVTAPHVRAVVPEGAWPAPAGDAGAALPIEVARLEVTEGRVAVALPDATPPRRFAATALALDARGHLARGGGAIEVTALRFMPRGLGRAPVEATGRVSADAGGVVRVRGLRLASGGSRLDGDVDLAGTRAVDARLALAPLAARDLRALVPAIRIATDARVRVRARGPWRALTTVAHTDLGAGGRVHARATVDVTARPLAYRAALDLAGLDPGAILPGLPAARVDGRLALRADGDAHRLRGVVRAAGGEAALRARLVPGAPPTYELAARVTLPRLETLDPRVTGSASGRVRLAGRGIEAADRHARAHLVLTRAVLRGVPLARGVARAAVDGIRVRLSSVRVTGPDLEATGTGRIDLAQGVADATLTASAELLGLGRRLGLPLAGAARASASVHGPLAALATRATATVERPAYGAAGAARVSARLAADGLGSGAASGTLHVDAPGFRVGDAPPSDASADLAWRRAGDGARARLTARAAATDGHVHTVTLALERTAARAGGRLEEATLALPGGPPWRLVAPAAFTIEDGLRTEGITLAAGAQRVTLGGQVALAGAANATLAVERLALGPLCALAALPPCAGEVTARAVLAGTASAPVVEATARAQGLAVDEVRYGILSLEARYAGARAELHAVLVHPQAGELSAAGSVPVDLAWAGPRRDVAGEPVDLAVRAERLDLSALRALAPHAIRSASGFVTVDLHVTGTRAAPRPVGAFTLEGGTLELAGTGIPYQDLRVRIAADGTALDVQELHARAGDGTADGGGRLDVAPGGAQPVALTLRFDRFLALRREGVEAAVSGTLVARGAVLAPEVSGVLDVDHAVVRPASTPGRQPAPPPDPTISVVGLEESPAAAAAGPTPDLPAPLALALTVRIARDAAVRRNDANIALGGELTVAKTRGEPARVRGQVRLVRGWFEFQGRRFDIQEGTITLGGGTPPEPIFDVTAVRRTSAYRIVVRITGSAEKPNLAFTSDPPLEQADILSVLLFGKPARELGRGQSLALQQQALQIATGYVVPQLRESVMNALGLDTLDVAFADRPDAPGQVRVGRYVAQDVLVSLGQEFGARVAQVVGVEYAVGTHVAVRASTSTRGASAVDLIWQRRY